jgi:hypothetical protein
MKDEEVEALQAEDRKAAAHIKAGSFGIGGGKLNLAVILAWLAVGLPLAWGVWITLEKALVLFE